MTTEGLARIIAGSFVLVSLLLESILAKAGIPPAAARAASPMR